jgi:hypothetical protein
MGWGVNQRNRIMNIKIIEAAPKGQPLLDFNLGDIVRTLKDDYNNRFVIVNPDNSVAKRHLINLRTWCGVTEQFFENNKLFVKVGSIQFND